MARSWYYDVEEDLEERCEMIGRGYKSQQEQEALLKSDDLNKMSTQSVTQMSMLKQTIQTTRRPVETKKAHPPVEQLTFNSIIEGIDNEAGIF